MHNIQRNAIVTTMVSLCFLSPGAHAAVSILVSGVSELNFGVLTENGAGGTATVTPAGARMTTGGVSGVSGGAFVSAGTFSVAGSTGLAIEISLTAPAYSVFGGGGTMVVDQFNLVTNAGGSNATVTLAANPSTFSLGARITLSGGQAEGTYSGTYSLTAVYQ